MFEENDLSGDAFAARHGSDAGYLCCARVVGFWLDASAYGGGASAGPTSFEAVDR